MGLNDDCDQIWLDLERVRLVPFGVYGEVERDEAVNHGLARKTVFIAVVGLQLIPLCLLLRCVGHILLYRCRCNPDQFARLSSARTCSPYLLTDQAGVAR